MDRLEPPGPTQPLCGREPPSVHEVALAIERYEGLTTDH